jgi:hypothetical protein
LSSAIANRLGQINLAGDPQAIFLKIYGGLVLEANDRAQAFAPRTYVRTIPNGKSAQFPAVGIARVGYHTPGAELLGTAIPHAERTINVEDLLVSDVFIPNIDELMNHYDVRAIYAGEQGQAMGKFHDQNIGRTLVNAARGTAAITGQPDGYSIQDADLDSDGNKIFAALFNAGVRLDQNDVDQDGRTGWLPPVQYALLVRSERPINRDVSPDNGSLAQGNIIMVNGIPIVKTNNMPNADDRTNVLMPARRQKDYSGVRMIVAGKQAVGTVQLQDLTMEMVYDPRRQGTLLIAKRLTGHDVLRVDAAVEGRTATPSV